MKELITDFLGQEYGVGDFVVYSSAIGRGTQLTLGRVKKINHENANGEPLVNRRYIYETKEYVDVSYFTVTIQPLSDSRNKYRSGKGVKMRQVNIGMVENIIKVDAGKADFEVYE